ncbi:MAG: YdcF family protein [Deltaproteobacteria bacterium]|nr:YdcF family protein [Deltaproteobacteria bacterium]
MTDRRRCRIVYLLAFVLLLAGSVVAHRFSAFGETDRTARGFDDRLMSFLMQGLVFEHPLLNGNGRPPIAASSMAYILGGTQESLSYKVKTVGRLYAEGTVGNILILHRPGITEYSPALGRNFTNDEWATGKLKEEGVAVENLEFVPVPPATFDTFAEARAISDLARARKVKRLVLVSSTHHTKRVWLSFSHFNGDNAFESYTYGSEEKADIFELLVENVKLGIYRHLVFPIDRLRGHFSSRRVALRTEKESFPEKTR